MPRINMKKCIVVDLDNTLWGGVIGEDGLEGIALSLAPPGDSFLAFQQAILDQYNKGIILAINSRNNRDDALAVLRTHPNMILKEPHFAAMRINWEDKVENLRELAAELNIGLDSMVFLDDDPTNRAWVRNALPEVTVPELPADPEAYTPFFLSLDLFENGELTDEDKMRGNMYVTERLRTEAAKSYKKRGDFLKSLNLELQIRENDASNLTRLAQLTGKTNQFNIRKHPISAEKLGKMINNGKHLILSGRLLDRFGDYGVIILAIVEINKKPWHISTLLMSCRVFDRGVEDALLAYIFKKAKAAGQKSISIGFKKSPKNAPAETFVKKHFKRGRTPVTGTKTPRWLTIMYG
jgi:FkbH-like protein